MGMGVFLRSKGLRSSGRRQGQGCEVRDPEIHFVQDPLDGFHSLFLE